MSISIPSISYAEHITGGPAAEKTAALVARAAALVKAGTQPSDVLFICGNPKQIPYVNTLVPEGVQVVSAAEVALDVLATPEAMAFTGRSPRVLLPYEEQFLFEDLRTTGLPQKPLRNVLGFLRASYARLKNWQDGWLEMLEEQQVEAALQDNLRFYDAMLAEEAPNVAAQFLLQAAPSMPRPAHVLVDDFHLFTRAEQVLCGLLARETIAISEEVVPEGEPATANLYGACNAGCTAHQHTYETIREEFDGIIAAVREAIDTDTPPASIAVVCENTTWQRNMVHMLEATGIAVQRPERPLRVRDFRDEEACAHVREDALAKLAENPHDGPAARTLFGLGDYMARSTALARLREAHPNQKIYEVEAIAATVDQSRGALSSARANGNNNETPTAAPPQATPSTPGVFVGSPNDIFGLYFDLVICGGCVGGWIPPRAYYDSFGRRKEKLAAQARTALTHAARAAGKNIIFTSFTYADLEFAERLTLKYTRIRLKNNVRTCTLLPFDTIE